MFDFVAALQLSSPGLLHSSFKLVSHPVSASTDKLLTVDLASA